jgi:hypothetical protein
MFAFKATGFCFLDHLLKYIDIIYLGPILSGLLYAVFISLLY